LKPLLEDIVVSKTLIELFLALAGNIVEADQTAEIAQGTAAHHALQHILCRYTKDDVIGKNSPIGKDSPIRKDSPIGRTCPLGGWRRSWRSWNLEPKRVLQTPTPTL
jgi:hypothetical protein